MIPPWPTLRLLPFLLLLLACVPRDNPREEHSAARGPSDPAAALPWKKVASRNGWSFVKLRQEGVGNLLIFGGTKDGIQEALGGQSVAAAGWDILTLSPEAAEPGARDDFFRFGMEQPGYRRRVLVVDGSDLMPVLRLRPDTLAGLVIVHPGAAGYPTLEMRTLLEELPENLPVLLLFGTAENPAAYYLSSLIRSSDKQIRIDASASILDGRILNFLHTVRFPSDFIESRKTFRMGCRMIPQGTWVIAHVSGERADGYCPLLLRFGGDVYRAVAVLTDAGCDYGITSVPAIRCR